VVDEENRWLDIDHIIFPESYSSNKIFVGLDAEDPVLYEKDEIDEIDEIDIHNYYLPRLSQP
jgi:hypothetical protein